MAANGKGNPSGNGRRGAARRPRAGRALRLAAAVCVAALAIGLGGCGNGSDVTLLGYSAPREAYEQIIPAFQRTPAGRDITFSESYGPSGDQSRAVSAGLDADVLALALAPDIDRLIDDGLVSADWRSGPTDGMVSNSVVVLITRPGNPKHIRGWDDLVRDDLEVITPNPLTSGGAQWNIAAAYGAQLVRGRSEDEALAYLSDLFHHVPVQPKGAREALQIFLAGKGDVLIAYESDALTARRKGEEIDYLIPAETVLIENPIAVGREAHDPAAARAFVRYAESPPAQEIFAQTGFRPVLPSVLARHAARFPRPEHLFTVEEVLGGWRDFQQRFFASSGYMSQIYAGRTPRAHD